MRCVCTQQGARATHHVHTSISTVRPSSTSLSHCGRFRNSGRHVAPHPVTRATSLPVRVPRHPHSSWSDSRHHMTRMVCMAPATPCGDGLVSTARGTHACCHRPPSNASVLLRFPNESERVGRVSGACTPPTNVRHALRERRKASRLGMWTSHGARTATTRLCGAQVESTEER